MKNLFITRIPVAVLFAVCILGHPMTSLAQGLDFDPVIMAALSFGGDKLAEIQTWEGTHLTDGQGERLRNSGTATIRAGRFVCLGAGLRISKPKTPWGLQVTLGYFVDRAEAISDVSNSDAFKFDRWPLESQLFFTQQKFRFGAGLTYHMFPKLKFSNGGDSFQKILEFNNALGYLLEAGYDTGYGWVSLKYAIISYDCTQGGSAKGNNIAFAWNLYLH